uniref:Type II toxin-antitoxin system HicB family antitoxin n=1 Tax=Schlesneria paludicola TaxID=360056 RepID=A0A7C2JZG2_9PLAN
MVSDASRTDLLRTVQFTLEYWENDGWLVGQLREWPAICSQGETLEELEENIHDAYQLMLEAEADERPGDRKSKTLVMAP